MKLIKSDSKTWESDGLQNLAEETGKVGRLKQHK